MKKLKKILRVGGMISLASLALLQGLPLQQEDISPICIEPVPKNIDIDNNLMDCNKIPIQLSHDLGVVLSGSNTSGAVALSYPFFSSFFSFASNSL